MIGRIGAYRLLHALYPVGAPGARPALRALGLAREPVSEAVLVVLVDARQLKSQLARRQDIKADAADDLVVLSRDDLGRQHLDGVRGHAHARRDTDGPERRRRVSTSSL